MTHPYMGSRLDQMKGSTQEPKAKALLTGLVAIGVAMVLLSLLANRLGLGHTPGFGWKKTFLLLTGVPLSVFSAWFLCTNRAREKLLPSVLGYAGISAIALALAAHRLRLGHNPELRWTKALLFVFGLGLTIVAGRLFCSRRGANRVFRWALAYLGVVTIAIAAAVHPLGLAADPAFRWKRQLLLPFGVSATALAALFPYGSHLREWFAIRRDQVTRAISIFRPLPATLGRYNFLSVPLHWRHRIILLLLPWIIFYVNPNWPFQNLGSMDPWYYFGEFIHFPHYERLMPNYAGERLMLILPGLVLARTFSPAYGLIAMHVLFYCLATFSLYYIVQTFTERRTALLTSCLLGCHPLFIGANGWSYFDGASIAYFLLTLAFIVRAASSRLRRTCLLLAGIWWASLVYSYPLWLALTPCFVYFYFAVGHQDSREFSLRAIRQRMVPFLTWFGMGAVLLTVALQVLHRALYGSGSGFFFRNNVETAFFHLTLEHSPWSSGNFTWITSGSWIVFPVLAFLLCAGLLLQHARRIAVLQPVAMASILVYLFCLGVLVVMTIRPNHLLEFDYFTSILIPSIFLLMGLTIFKVPDTWQGPRLYFLVALCCAVCLAPLWKVNLYRMALVGGLTLTYAIGVAGVGIRLLWPNRTASWVVSLGALSVASFALVPGYPGIAWRAEYDGLASTKRIASAISLIEERLPAENYPAFWINNVNGRLVGESRAIMCGFLSHGFSMWGYPRIDAQRVYKPGTFVILITEERDVFDAANQTMTRAGMPLSLYGQDLVSARGSSYWLTYVRVLKRVSQAPVGRVAPPPRMLSVGVGADAWPRSVRLGPQASAEISLMDPATRQLFRSDVDSNSGWAINRYGRSGGLTIKPNCLFAGDSCGLYASGDPRDHLASPFVAPPFVAPPVNPLVFFSIWVKPIQGAGSFRVFVQDQSYRVLAEGHELATRDDGWKLYGDWLNVPDEQEVRLVVITSSSQPLFLDKAELLEVATELPQTGARAEKRN